MERKTTSHCAGLSAIAEFLVELPVQSLTLAVSIAHAEIFFLYSRCTSVFVPKLQWLSKRSGAHKLFHQFLEFSKFYTRISRNCGATWRQKWELCTASERASPCEKAENRIGHVTLTHKPLCNTCSNYAPLERTALLTRSMTKMETK